MMQSDIKQYLLITGGYWGFTLTDGAIRMLVVLYFHQLGYSPLQVAMLFLFYEFFGIVTNLLGGWLGARIGLNKTMNIGMAMQVFALSMLTVPAAWLSVPYVMFAQALSGIAKDLNKMSAKSSVKLLVPETNAESRLFRWIAVLTGSKNALKGAGFFLGAGLLDVFGFRMALAILAGLLFMVLISLLITLPANLGKAKSRPKFSQLFSPSVKVNWLSAARFFLFGSRDVWFVVALPLYLYSVFDWSFTFVGAFMASWIIGYGIVQASTPVLLSRHPEYAPTARSIVTWAFILSFIPAGIAMLMGYQPELVLVIGLLLFGLVFAVNSAVHSYLIVSWSEHENVSMNVGFYYMANAGGRLTGTVLSGWVYQSYGLEMCLYISSAFIMTAALLSTRLVSKP
jgi:predicted MFS family arabinose efflux permease